MDRIVLCQTEILKRIEPGSGSGATGGYTVEKKQMKILLLAVGTRGDVQPFVALGRSLQARGHAVTLAAPPGFEEMARAAGIDYRTLPVDFQVLMQEPEMKAAMTTLRGKLRAYRWANEIMNAQLSAIWEIGLEVAPDVILNHFKGALAPQLARKLGAVSIPVLLQPGFAETGAYPQFLIAKRSLGRVGNRASHKLIHGLMRMGTRMLIRKWSKASGVDIGAPMNPMLGYAPDREAPRLHAYSPTLIPRPAGWPSREIQTGYFFSEAPDFTPPEGLAAFLDAGPTPIYVGFGSMPGMDHERTTEALLGALEKVGLRAVVATGWGGIDTVSGSGIHVLDSVPHPWLFPRVSAVVHHGGSGTTHEGLRWGRPSVICPLFADQPFFGARVADLGCGPEPIAQKRLSADGLARALDMALRPEVAVRSEQIGARIRAEDGLGRACETIEAIG